MKYYVTSWHRIHRGDEDVLKRFHRDTPLADSEKEAIDLRIKYEQAHIDAKQQWLDWLKENRDKLQKWHINDENNMEQYDNERPE